MSCLHLFLRSSLHLTTRTSLFPSSRRCGTSPPLLLQNVPTQSGRLPMGGCRGGPYLALPGSPFEISSPLRPQTGLRLSGTLVPFPRRPSLPPPRRRRPPLLPLPPPLSQHPHPTRSPAWEWTFEQVSGNSPTDTPSPWRYLPLWTRGPTRPRTTAPSVWTTSWSVRPQNATTTVWFNVYSLSSMTNVNNFTGNRS